MDSNWISDTYFKLYENKLFYITKIKLEDNMQKGSIFGYRILKTKNQGQLIFLVPYFFRNYLLHLWTCTK